MTIEQMQERVERINENIEDAEAAIGALTFGSVEAELLASDIRAWMNERDMLLHTIGQECWRD